MSCVFFSRQKTAYEMRISDWSSDVCSSDLQVDDLQLGLADRLAGAGDLRLVRGEAAVDFRLRALERQKPRPPLQALVDQPGDVGELDLDQRELDPLAFVLGPEPAALPVQRHEERRVGKAGGCRCISR